MTKQTPTLAQPEYIVGITQHCLYVLATASAPLAPQHTGQHREYLPLQWLANRTAFFQQVLQGRNLLMNSDFGEYLGQHISGWESETDGVASVGVDFSDKWRLADGHTAFIFAPAEAPRPVLRLAEAIPLITDLASSKALNYRLSGFFGTHRADGIITIEFFDADNLSLGSEVLRIPQSDEHLGGLLPENYQYKQWDVQPIQGATQASLACSLGAYTGGGSPDSFLFAAHLYFGVADTAHPSAWTPYSAGAYELSSHGQNHAWKAFGIALLPQTDNKQKISITIGDKKHSFVPENAAIPEYLKAINALIQNRDRLFDPQFYAQSSHDALNIYESHALQEHYQSIGWRVNRSPSPYFDLAWYRVNNPEVIAQDIDPLQHFINTGSAAHRSPHPLFDAQWYYQTYLAHDHPSAQPLFHYLDDGWRQGYHPHPLFWTRWYEKAYLGKNAGKIDPFYHFLTEGWQNNNNPNPLFDTAYYLQEHAAKSRIEPDPLSHYIHVGWRENFQPHILFDPTYYAMQSGYNIQLAQRSPLADFFATEKVVSPHPLFDVDFYREQVGDGLAQHPLIDYLERGWQGDIDPNPMFSKSFYYKHAQGLEKQHTDALIHYLESGWKKNQTVHPLFNAKYYLEQNTHAHGCIPLQHYLMQGWHKGYNCRPSEDARELIPKKLPDTRITLCVPDDRLLAPINSVNSAENPRIGVFAHIFHVDLTAEMITASNNIPDNCTVFISTDTLVKMRGINDVCQMLSRHPFEIRILPNRGRDIATMVCGFRDRFQEVDYGVHIHSKRSSHFDSAFADGWRRHSIEGNLGSPELVRNILALLSDERIGAYAPEHYDPIRPLIQWTGNFSTVKKLLEMCSEDISKEHSLDFPSGSMFWFKTKALKPLLSLNLRPYHFEAEKGQTDNTLAHAIERSFFYFVEISGHAWIIGEKVSGIAAERAVATLAAYQGPIANLANRLFPCNRELGGLRRYFGQCTRFLVHPSLIEKPRINLLIPTLNPGQGHIDTGAALALFAVIRQTLGTSYDARIITTDVSPELLSLLPEGYQAGTPVTKDQLDVDVVTDAAQRFRYPFLVRNNDIFIATAWWTALNTLDILKQQNSLFGERQRAFVYFIQDVEFSFYPWSSQSALAEQTYRHPDKIIPVFNTDRVFDYFKRNGYFSSGHVTYPQMDPALKAAISYNTPKEKIVLVHTRPHIERQGFPFIDVLLQAIIAADPVFWSAWQFLAIGDHIDNHTFKTCPTIAVLGQLPVQQYAELASKAALAVSLMVSPHPSQAALEMAEAGVLVLTNGYAGKDLSGLHDNISNFDLFDIDSVAGQFRAMAERWSAQPDIGWQGKPRVAWFYGKSGNMQEVGEAVAGQISAKLFPGSPQAD
ncbi:MAG: rhamnan synthesis F family protein [Methylovulum sp.]|nr:rhamnan synthesis F family protein [Methylovulum sp.]